MGSPRSHGTCCRRMDGANGRRPETRSGLIKSARKSESNGGLFSSVGRYGFSLWGFPIHSTRRSRKSRERVDFLADLGGFEAGGVHLVNSPCSSTAIPFPCHPLLLGQSESKNSSIPTFPNFRLSPSVHLSISLWLGRTITSSVPVGCGRLSTIWLPFCRTK